MRTPPGDGNFGKEDVRPFQSPSNRVAALPQPIRDMTEPTMPTCFNPLLIGAGALPRNPCPRSRDRCRAFQPPAHRGGSAPHARWSSGRPCQEGPVSIPFSSGRERSRINDENDDYAIRAARFNPLLIGAGALPFCPRRHCDPPHRLGFNPLLIGAGALPFSDVCDNCRRADVSIPFSSGRERSPRNTWRFRWRRLFQSPSHRGGSAPTDSQGLRMKQKRRFQSPSHRGGSAPAAFTCSGEPGTGFNPLLIGAGALPRVRECQMPLRAQDTVSIPFSSGRERSRSIFALAIIIAMFQSPSHRGGSAPLLCQIDGVVDVDIPFQSPSHRGGSAPHRRAERGRGVSGVSIPFSSGRERSQVQVRYPCSHQNKKVSIPFSSGRERSCPASTISSH